VALFPVPDPNSFEDFKNPTDNEVLAIVNLVK
jgi:hypothetical protein